MKRFASALFALLFVCATLNAARIAARFNGEWNESNMWNATVADHMPGETDTAIFRANRTVVLPENFSATIALVEISGQANGTDQLTINGNLFTTGASTIATAVGTNGSLVINSTGNATLSIRKMATAANSTATLRMSGGKLIHETGDIEIATAANSTATLVIHNGKLTPSALNVANNTAAAADISLTNTTLVVPNALTLADGENAALTITLNNATLNATSTTTATLLASAHTTATTQFTLRNNATLITAKNFVLGSVGSATLDATASTLTLGGEFHIGGRTKSSDNTRATATFANTNITATNILIGTITAAHAHTTHDQLDLDGGTITASAQIIIGGTPVSNSTASLSVTPKTKLRATNNLALRQGAELLLKLDPQANDFDIETSAQFQASSNTSLTIDASKLDWHGARTNDTRSILLVKHPAQSTTNFNNLNNNLKFEVINHDPALYAFSKNITQTQTTLEITCLLTTPVIRRQPAAATTQFLGTPTTLTADIIGHGLAYQWQISLDGGQTWTDITGATNPTIELSNTDPALSDALYRCQATDNQNNTVTTDPAQITLYGQTALRTWGQTAIAPASTQTPVRQIALGAAHTLALHTDGSLSAWGDNTHAQCELPEIPSGKTITAIAARANYNLALLSDGTLVGWGENTHGQTTIPAGLANVIQISAGNNHAIARFSDNTIVTWGCDHTAPAAATNIADIAAGENHFAAIDTGGTLSTWGYNLSNQRPAGAINNVRQVAAGFDHTQILRTDGTITSRGDNTRGQTAAPSGTFTQIASGHQHTIALGADGKLYGYGRNTENQFPSNYTPPAGTSITQIAAAAHRSAALLSDGTLLQWGQALPNHAQVSPPTATPVEQLAASRSHTIALLSDGNHISWGCNAHNETTVPYDEIPIDTYLQILAGFHYSMILHSGGTLSIWGDTANPAVSQFPANINSTQNIRQIAAGRAHAAALHTDGSLSLWGDNTHSQLDHFPTKPIAAIAAAENYTLVLHEDGTLGGAGTSPVLTQLPRLANIRQIAAGRAHALALDTDGNLSVWGDNTHNQLDTPEIPSGKTILQIAAGTNHSILLLDDGTAITWGDDHARQTTAQPANLGALRGIAAGHNQTHVLIDTTPLQILQQPADHPDPADGETVTYHIRTYGGFNPTYQWQISRDKGQTWTDIEGATTATLTQTHNAAAPAQVRVQVTDTNGTLTYSTPAQLGTEIPPTETAWQNPDAGDWHTPANWDNGIPTATLNAILNQGTATIAAAAATQYLHAGTIATATANLILTETANLETPYIRAYDGNFTLINDGTLNAAKDVYLAWSTTAVTNLTNSGNITTEAMWGGDGALNIHNTQTGNISLSYALYCNVGYGHDSTIRNDGTLHASNISLLGDGQSTLNLTNTGNISAGYIMMGVCAGNFLIQNTGDITARNIDLARLQDKVSIESAGNILITKNTSLSSDEGITNITLNHIANFTTGNITSESFGGTAGVTLNNNSAFTVTETVNFTRYNLVAITLNHNSTLTANTLLANSNTSILVNLDDTRTAAPIRINNPAASTLAANFTVDISRLTAPPAGESLDITLVETPAHTPAPQLPDIRITGEISGHTSTLDWNTDGTRLLLTIAPAGTAPVIIAPPGNRTLNFGDTHTLPVTAGGTAPLAYQWFRDAVEIPFSNNATLTIANATPADSGSYTVLVTNPYGTATAGPALITLNLDGDQLLDYALNPASTNDGSLSHLPQVSANKTTGLLEMVFTPLREELDYTVQATTDLRNWTDLLTVRGNATAPKPVTVSAPDSGTNPRQFLRLKISIPKSSGDN